MSKKTDLDALVLLSDDEFHDRIAAASARIETRVQRATDEGRDLLPREHDLSAQDRDELVALRDAEEIRAARAREAEAVEQREQERAQLVGRAIDEARNTRQTGGCPSLLVSELNLRRHADAMAEGHSFGAVEQRATIQGNALASNTMGAPTAWAQTSPRDPRHLIGYANIPAMALTGVTAVAPRFTLPAGAAGVAETTAHPEFDTVVDVPLTAVRHGRWSKVTAAVNQFDPLVGLNSMHAIGIARNLDLAAVTDIETAAGAPITFATDIAANMRLALNTVAAQVYSQVEDLVIFGTPANIALLQDIAPTSGPDAGSVTARFSGARLYPTIAATPGVLTAFAPHAFVTFVSPLQSASQVDPTDGSNSFGSWLHSTGVAMGLVGGAIAVDVASP